MNHKCFKIGTFNLLNLALPQQIFYEREYYTPEEYIRKRDWTAEQLNRMQADIVGFQEVLPCKTCYAPVRFVGSSIWSWLHPLLKLPQ